MLFPTPHLSQLVSKDLIYKLFKRQTKKLTFCIGFITTAHYLKTSSYVQITGFFDRSKYNLGSNDGGGQYDNHAHGKPVGAQCKGYNYFVNLVEPDIDRFCIRCCQDKVYIVYFFWK
jgi:hypothetical protein